MIDWKAVAHELRRRLIRLSASYELAGQDIAIHGRAADIAEDRLARLRAAFIRHRTATHVVKPIACQTCQESDAIIVLLMPLSSASLR